MESLHQALANATTEIGGQVDRFVSYIYSTEDFRTFHRMMMRRNVELDILAMRALKEQGVDVAIPDVDDVLGTPAQTNNQRGAAMAENAGYDEEEALRLAIEESLKYQGMSSKRLELEDAELQEALALSTQIEADKARVQKKEVAKEVAIVAQSDPAAAAHIQAQKTAVIEQKAAQNVQALEEKTLRMREEKVREVVEHMASPETAPEPKRGSAHPPSKGPAPAPTKAPAAAPAQKVPVVGPPSFGGAKAPPPSFGGKTLGFAALPSLGLGQPPLSVLKEKVEKETAAAHPSNTPPVPAPTKEEFEARARYMREQREKILQRNKASRQQELQDYAKQNSVNVNVNSSANDAEKQLTVDIARRLRGDILGEVQKK